MKQKRILGIDILKVIGVILVLTVHFFLNTKFYQTSEMGINMRLQAAIKNFCLICVPLFMTITGYLNKELSYNKNFFKKLLNIIIIWIFYSIIEFFTLNIVNNTHNLLNIKNFIYSLTSFTACGYSWYINMYIGLYFISPFINNTFKNFDEKNKKISFILSILIFILPTFINAIFGNLLSIPNWWTNSYPIAYYMLGKYISYRQPNFNKKILILCLISIQLFLSSYSLSFPVIGYNILLLYISTAIIFLLFYNVNIKNKIVRNIIIYISTISLDIYLGSSLIDKLIYPMFSKILKFKDLIQQQIIFYAPLILIIVFILSSIYGTIRKKLINVR